MWYLYYEVYSICIFKVIPLWFGHYWSLKHGVNRYNECCFLRSPLSVISLIMSSWLLGNFHQCVLFSNCCKIELFHRVTPFRGPHLWGASNRPRYAYLRHCFKVPQFRKHVFVSSLIFLKVSFHLTPWTFTKFKGMFVALGWLVLFSIIRQPMFLLF